jgi:hypothetical protein
VTERPEGPDRLADELEHRADQLDQHSQELGQDIKDVRDDWQRKRADEGVPGAVPEPEDDAAESDEDANPDDVAARAGSEGPAQSGSEDAE